jgi:hypothetical protein
MAWGRVFLDLPEKGFKHVPDTKYLAIDFPALSARNVDTIIA